MKNNLQSQNKFYWVYLAGFFLIMFLPLLNLPPWFSPPDWGKTIVFRIVMSILIFLSLLNFLGKNLRGQVIWQKIFPFKSALVFWLLIALLAISTLATIFSIDRNFSLWGDPYRSGGFLNFAFYIIFAILSFLILRKSDWPASNASPARHADTSPAGWRSDAGWQKIWDFSLVIGIFVSMVAIFQLFSLITEVFIPSWRRPPSTIGGPIFLAVYLLLLSFPALSFGIKSKVLAKKFFYFISFLLFIFVAIFITQTRAVFIGLVIGSLWFIFAYPKRLMLLKILAGVFLILGIFGFYFLKTHPEVYSTQGETTQNVIQNAINRILSIAPSADQSRISAWKVSLEAIKNKPILGYGSENFSIGFDKYYDPSLPDIKQSPEGIRTWWDRAHNFVFDIGVTAGIPALIVYLTLFGVLFWQLQKLKYNANTTNENPNATNNKVNPIIPHALQATFIGYLAANFFSFDTFSSYLIFFLLVAYSLHLLSNQVVSGTPGDQRGFMLIKRIYADILKKISTPIIKQRRLILLFLFFGLVWFNWQYNIKPFQINTQINIAENLADHQFYDAALTRLEKQFKNHSILDHYLRLEYGEIIGHYIYEKPEIAGILAEKARNALLENTKIRPYYTRNWLLLGTYTNILIEGETNPDNKEKLKEEANYYLEKAFALSPRRQEVFIEWVKTDLVTDEYQKAKEKSQQCIDLNEKLPDCWWLMGLTDIYLGNEENGQKNIQIAKEKGYNIETKNSLLSLIKAYGTKENYQKVIESYTKLIALEPNNPQHRATLAFLYKQIGDYEKARQQALEVLRLAPENKEQVEEFLRGLPY